jgi:hypothetical protein
LCFTQLGNTQLCEAQAATNGRRIFQPIEDLLENSAAIRSCLGFAQRSVADLQVSMINGCEM